MSGAPGAPNRWASAVGVLGGHDSVAAAVDAAAERFGSSPYLHEGDRVVTFGDVAARARAVAAGLRDLGVRSGDVVPLYMGNSIELVVVSFALHHLGAASAPLNTEYRGELLAYFVDDLGARFAVVDAALLEQFSPGALRLRSTEGDPAIVLNGRSAAAPAGLRVLTLEECSSASPIGFDAQVVPTHADLAMVLYTGGTTGPSKGVMISHGHALTYATDFCACMGLDEDDVVYTALPLFHALAYLLGVVSCLLSGVPLHLDRRFSASRFWERVRETDATVAHAVFTMVPILLGSPPGPADRDHRLRAMYMGPSRYRAAFAERFGTVLFEGYGQTETGIVLHAEVGDGPAGSCGRVDSSRYEVRLADDDDLPVAAGRPGQVLVRPKLPFTSMLGYWGKDQLTVRASTNLWHHSGDRAFQDDGGWFHYVDRISDLIRRRGENISPYEIELVVAGHPDLVECCAFGVPSELEEEEVKICVVPREPASFDVRDLTDFLVSELPRFMVPRYVEAVDSLPKTAAEKVERFRLRERGRAGAGRTWDRERSEYLSTDVGGTA